MRISLASPRQICRPRGALTLRRTVVVLQLENAQVQQWLDITAGEVDSLKAAGITTLRVRARNPRAAVLPHSRGAWASRA